MGNGGPQFGACFVIIPPPIQNTKPLCTPKYIHPETHTPNAPPKPKHRKNTKNIRKITQFRIFFVFFLCFGFGGGFGVYFGVYVFWGSEEFCILYGGRYDHNACLILAVTTVRISVHFALPTSPRRLRPFLFFIPFKVRTCPTLTPSDFAGFEGSIHFFDPKRVIFHSLSGPAKT